jgi:ribonuclease BN (tRNA processing enzyme)
MSGMSLLPLGVGDAFSGRYYSSCLAVHADGAWLLIDCPHPIRKLMREASALAQSAGVNLDIAQVTAVALTHLHADHCSGLEGFGFFSRFNLERRAILLAHPAVSARLWDGHLAGGMEVALQGPGVPAIERTLDEFFDVRPLACEEDVSVGPFRLRCRLTNHTVPTTGLCVEAAGRVLGYSADTAFDPVLISWLADADLIVHETNPGFLHTPYEQLAALPEALRNRMRLIHYPDDFDLDNSAIEPLRQGRYYSV